MISQYHNGNMEVEVECTKEMQKETGKQLLGRVNDRLYELQMACAIVHD